MPILMNLMKCHLRNQWWMTKIILSVLTFKNYTFNYRILLEYRCRH